MLTVPPGDGPRHTSGDSPEEPPLSILFVQHVPWRRELGAGRVVVELAEALEHLGHRCEHFTAEEAYGTRWPRSKALVSMTHLGRSSLFYRRARAYVRQHASSFDVIDAREMDLPHSARELGVRGVVVARSVGLHLAYSKWEIEQRRRWPDLPRGRISTRFVRRVAQHHENRRNRRQLAKADLIMVPNKDEAGRLEEALGLGARCVAVPYGLHESTRSHLAAVVGRTSGPPIVGFIGTWDPRKGSRDWNAIAAAALQQHPDVRFRFVGTSATREDVMRDLPDVPAASVEVVPRYLQDDLPGLLAGLSVSCLPSYAEGFGFAVIESLAAGVPVVAYAADGPAEILAKLPDSLAPIGDVDALADRLSRVLALSGEQESALRGRARALADEYQWSRIAMSTEAAYRAALADGSRSTP